MKTKLIMGVAGIGCLVTVFVISSVAQTITKTGKIPPPRSDRAEQIALEYLRISSMSVGDRRKNFSELTPQKSAEILRFHMAFQLASRPSLTREQQDLIFEVLQSTTRDLYDRSQGDVSAKGFGELVKMRMASTFTPRDAAEIFSDIKLEKIGVAVLSTYLDVTKPTSAVQRRNAFSKLSPQDKSSTFKVHIVEQIAKRNLTTSQLKFLLDGIALISPELYGRESYVLRNPTFTAAIEYGERVPWLFEQKEAREIFVSLEGFDDEFELEGGMCSCSLQSDYCGWYQQNAYCAPNIPCESTLGGCGTLLLYDCVSHCRRN